MIAFLLSQWKLVALGLVVAAIGIYVAVLKGELSHCNNEREALEQQVTGLKGAIEAQNAAVAALKAAGDAKVAKATSGLKQARTASLAAQAEAARLKAAATAKSAPVAAGGCLAADGVKAVREGL